MLVYRIKNWNEIFETHRTRDLKNLQWVPIPNRHDGDGYTELLDHPGGASHYGAWCVLLQIASKCDPRGTLLRKSLEPHTPESLARMARFPIEIMREAMTRLASIGWLETYEDAAQSRDDARFTPTPPAAQSRDDARETRALDAAQNRAEWKGMEGKEEREREESSGGAGTEESDFDDPDPLMVVLRGLKVTGKLPELKHEHLVLVAREYPQAKIHTNWEEIAAEARGVVGTIGATLPWLRKAVSRLEVRQIQVAPAPAVGAEEKRVTFKGYAVTEAK
jgi:hypothetical protein